MSRIKRRSCDIVDDVSVLDLWSERGLGLLRGEGGLPSTVVMQGLAYRATVVHIGEKSSGLL